MTYFLRYAVRADVPQIYDVFREGAANLGGPVASATIASWITPSRLALVLVRRSDAQIVGASLSRFPTAGVCYHCVFAIRAAVRGQGLGGAMIAGGLRVLAAPGGRYRAHKWFASYPARNTDVDALYRAMGWVHEGTLRWHTRARTDLIVRAFYLPDGVDLPAFWHETHRDAPVVEWTLLTLPPLMSRQPSILDSPRTVPDQGHDGAVW